VGGIPVHYFSTQIQKNTPIFFSLRDGLHFLLYITQRSRFLAHNDLHKKFVPASPMHKPSINGPPKVERCHSRSSNFQQHKTNLTTQKKTKKRQMKSIPDQNSQPATTYPKMGFFGYSSFDTAVYVCMYVIGSAYASVDAQIRQSGDKLALQISNSRTTTTRTTQTRTQSIRPPSSSFLLEKTLHQRLGICGAGCFERGTRRRSGRRHSRLILNENQSARQLRRESFGRNGQKIRQNRTGRWG
jgi:hypothetical protein